MFCIGGGAFNIFNKILIICWSSRTFFCKVLSFRGSSKKQHGFATLTAESSMLCNAMDTPISPAFSKDRKSSVSGKT